MQECLVCSGNDFAFLYNKKLLKCKNCSFVTANIQFSNEQLKTIYGKNYFNGDEYQNYLADKDIIQKNFYQRLNLILKRTDRISITNTLEIGCAYGFWGEIVRNKLSSSYLGIDISDDSIKHAKENLKLNVLAGDYLEINSPQSKYSDVFMWDVIEHLLHPEKYLEKISQEIISEGRLYITTGNIDALLPSIQKEKWRMIHPPTHLHYFSKKTISHLLARSGFTVEKIYDIPIYRSVRQIYYSLFMLNKNYGKTIRKIYETIPAKAFFKINTFDILFVIAKKQ